MTDLEDVTESVLQDVQGQRKGSILAMYGIDEGEFAVVVARLMYALRTVPGMKYEPDTKESGAFINGMIMGLLIGKRLAERRLTTNG